ncbi:capsular polysaccharide biosynthesis protein Cps4B [Streptococcus sobrinus]|uniref:Tyrosine-protein phosphatase n=5 Tax=Streptococcus sobrinus TaxID=1310 RepID=U2KG84_9STRE|nr:capsular polysaccharide biosynthesis protein Cps4B [Streptococcus sobrinus]AWN19483.1 tyrosine protein phosphatase [Streptococcus sobrinus]AWN62219.1 tyrosine protein phosphatase [Streptococcus sobrinus]AWN64093.1 tyrosine protein phosphatase [Streptococcus sobrinus]ERJ76174.1 protein-tyrosine-phosphatase [Streptococcus sobrinus W1703]OZV22956.1 tyrosine protein phosphatase [Streptococcus sobrinus]
MIDIHSHIVFDVDDGPKTLKESLNLISESYRQGVRTIVSTSHRRKDMFETPEETIRANFLQVKKAAEEKFPDLTILYGGELYYTEDLRQKLEKGLVPTMDGSRYALMEFSMATPWRDIHQALTKVLMLGVTPIVAHIERYNALENKPDRVQEIINMGCYTQVNSNHVLKPKLFGDKEKTFKVRGRYFLEQDLVYCIASDMHNLDKRPPFMEEAYQVITKTYGETKAQALFKDNLQDLLDKKTN